MSKAKAYTKMILERLQKKTELDLPKSNASSNQKTQATPSDQNSPHLNPKAFFQNFQTNCAVYHEPVYWVKNKRSMRRPLVFELKELQSKMGNSGTGANQGFRKDQKNRMQTEPFVQEFKLEEVKKPGVRVFSKDLYRDRDSKSVMSRRVEEKPIKTITHGPVSINRYKSLKTMPSKSTTFGQSCSYRRTLVSPHSMIPIDRRQSFEKRQVKYERKRQQPRRELIHRCDSYDRYLLGRVC